MKGWLDWLLNSGLDPVKTDPFELLRYRQITAVAAICAAIAFAFDIRAIQWGIASRVIVLSLAVLGCIAIIVGLRMRRKPDLFAHLLTAIILMACINSVYTNGGISGYSGAWLVLAPLVGQVLVSRKAGAVWGLCALLAGVMFFAAERYYGLVFANLTPEQQRPGQLMFQIIGFTIAVWVLAGTLLRQLDIAKIRLREELVHTQHEIEQRREAEVKAQQASLAKSRFLANMRHELRTPLNAIIGYSSRLEQKFVGRASDKEMDAIIGVRRNGEHLLMLINELLDIAKIEADDMELSLVHMDLAKLISETVASMRSTFQERGVGITCRGPQSCMIVADHQRIQQVVVTLLHNGLKYVDQGEVTLTLHDNDNHVVLNFADTGVGLNREQLSQVFDEANHIHSPERKSLDISELSLPLVAKLVRLNGGDIKVSSKLGAGSTFTVVLPKRLKSSQADS